MLAHRGRRAVTQGPRMGHPAGRGGPAARRWEEAMLEFVGEVAVDLAGMFINPDAEPMHPAARAVALVAACVAIAIGLASIYAQDGVIAL